MARVAHRGHDLELAVGRVLVAGITIHCRMRPGEREAVVVLLNFLNRYAPAADGVTLFAIGAQLPLVNVGVAVLAAFAHVAEYRLHVTLRTRHILVHAAQWITGLVVIEFRHRADRLPAFRCVAVLAGDIQTAVWAMGTGAALTRRTRERG